MDFLKPVQTSYNWTDLYVDGPDCMSMILSEIEKAKYHIHIQVMLFYSDDAGFKIANALREKAKQGVSIRVMSDSDISKVSRMIEMRRSSGHSDFEKVSDLFDASGIQYISSAKESFSESEWGDLREKLHRKGVENRFLELQDLVQKNVSMNLNVVDHRKLIVIDGETAIVTSLNLGDRFLFKIDSDLNEAKNHWHDGAVLLKGPCASVLNQHFASKWMVRGGDLFDYKLHYRTKEKYGDDLVTIYFCFPGNPINQIQEYFLNKVRECKGDFIIQNPYVNDEQFWNTLAQLDTEQVSKIHLINPYSAEGNDYPSKKASIRCNIWKPLLKGLNFYDYNSSMSHFKIALDVAEDEVFHGSYNLNNRSALHDFELNVLIKSSTLAQKVKHILETDMGKSRKIINKKEFYKYPALHPSCYMEDTFDFYE